MIVRSSLLLFLPFSSPPPHIVSYPFFERGGMLFYTHMARQSTRVEGEKILSFRRSIAFQIARRGRVVEFHGGGLNGIPLEHREDPRRSVKGCISSAATLFVAGQSDYAEKFRYATILRGLYARVEIPFALNWIRSPFHGYDDNFFFFFSFFSSPFFGIRINIVVSKWWLR